MTPLHEVPTSLEYICRSGSPRPTGDLTWDDVRPRIYATRWREACVGATHFHTIDFRNKI
jgi:hypothetical protein